MKKKIFFFSIIILIFFIWNDYKTIDLSYINQNKITYNYNNLNNNFLKKIHKILNKKFENFLVNNFDKHKNYWDKENLNIRKNLPDEKIIKEENKPTLNIYENEKNFADWPRSHGNNYSNRFSNLKQINSNNAHNLKIAWIYLSKDEKNDIQANPIAVNGIIYTPVAGGFVVAIDGSTGEEIWRSKKFGNFVARRGLVYWKGDAFNKPRLIFSNRERLIALDAETGKAIKTFGKKGKVRTGLNVMTPVLLNDKIIIVTWSHAVEVYDLFNGEKKWKLKFKNKINKRFGGKKYNNLGANPWGGISLDEKRKILYFTTGNPHHYFDGTQRPGRNEGSNSIIAVDIKNKKIMWSFQETAHDIWNYDLPAPPVLSSIKKDNNIIDVVITPTKRANTLIVDRLTGNPIFDFKLRKAPVSNLNGEKTNPYQPDLDLPEKFGKNILLIDDLWSYNNNKLKKHLEKYKNHRFGFYQTYELNQKNLQYNFHGGAEWMGASVDHDNNIMYVTSNNIPWETGVTQINNKNESIPIYSSYFKRALDDKGYPITKPPWGTLTSLNLNNGKIIWQVPLGDYKEISKNLSEKTGTENFGGVTSTSGNISIATGTLDKKIYIFNNDNGKIIYEKKLPFIGSAPPTTYLSDGKQYIIVHSTGGFSLKKGYPNLVETGNALVAFKLK